MSKYRHVIIRKLNIVLSLVLSAAVLVSTVFASGVAAVLGTTQETTQVTAKTNSFTTTKSVTFTAETATAVTVTETVNSDYDTNFFDLIIIPLNDTDTANLSLDGNAEWKYGMNSATGYSASPTGAKIYTNLLCTSGAASVSINNSSAGDISANVYAVRHSRFNYFVGSFFEFKLSANEYFDNCGTENTAKPGSVPHNEVSADVYEFQASDSYANIYVVNDFTIDEDYEYNVPADIFLMESDVTLNADLTIKHGYNGLYEIKSDNGIFSADTSGESRTLTINTPNAYYETNPANFTNITLTKESDALDLDEPENSDILIAVKADAMAYVEEYLKSQMYPGTVTEGDAEVTKYYTAKSFTLPKTYYNYGITFSYDANGYVTRGMNNSASTALTATASYKDTVFDTYTHNYYIIGTNPSYIYSTYINVLGYYISSNQLTGAALSTYVDDLIYGVDILKFTEQYSSDTGMSENFTLDFVGHELEFEKITSEGTQHLSSVNAADFMNANALIVKHPYYITDGSDKIRITAGVNSEFIFDSGFLNYKGCSYDELDGYLDRLFPQLYLANGTTTLDILNIRNDENSTGTYLGSSQLLPSTLSVKNPYIAYGIYYLNEAATDALEGLDAYIAADISRTSDTRNNILNAMFTNVTNNDYTAYIASSPTYTGALISTDYEGKPLINTATPSSGHFTFENGVLTMLESQLTVYGGSLVLIGSMNYTGEADGAVPRYIVRTLYSPASGLGGEDKQYSKSNVLSDQFGDTGNWITRGTVNLVPKNPAMKIQSIEYTVTSESGDEIYTGDVSFTGAFPYTGLTPTSAYTENQGVTTSAPPANNFYNIRWNTDKFVFTVTPDNVPTENSIVNVSVVITDGSNPMTETYSFVIPGIYRYTRDISDIWIYLRMLQVYGNHDGYLYVDDVKNYSGTFDCSFNTLNTSVTVDDININAQYLFDSDIIPSVPTAPALADLHNLNGIQYAINTTGFTFDNVKVNSLIPFNAFSSSSAVSLSMQNCGINSAMLQGTGENTYPLYKLNKLTTVDLTGNSITVISRTNDTDTKYILYRTVTDLTLDSCNLTSLDGIDRLVNLSVLSIQTNNVKDFYPIVGMSSLSEVHLGSNTVSGDTENYYGTHGKINLCNIVELMHNDVTVYVEPKTVSGVLTDVITRIYEKVGTDYYFDNEIDSTDEITAATEAGLNILSSNGYLISTEQEYLATVVNAFYNFEKVKVSPRSYTDQEVMNEIFDLTSNTGTINIDSSTNTDTGSFKVTVEDITGDSSSSVRKYRFKIQYNGSNYIYSSNYVGGSTSAFMEVSREITFNVVLS